MSYRLAAFIGSEPTVATAGALVGEHRLSRLGRNLHIVELDSRSRNALFSDDFRCLTPAIAAAAAAASTIGDIAYVEAMFFGGEGLQASIAWREGEVVFGPARADDDEPPVPPVSDWPINRALRFLGVKANTDMDEFRTLDLGRFK